MKSMTLDEVAALDAKEDMALVAFMTGGCDLV